MAYSELVKDFGRIRSYMREFYVYGFKSRSQYDEKSLRSYDNERRRVESWLGEYMRFTRDASGKTVFLSVDSRRIPRNPLYRALGAKSFTDRDVTLHFYILDALAEGEAMTCARLLEHMEGYLAHFDGSFTLDESTLRKKLKEYVALGLLIQEKRGREVLYRRSPERGPELSSWGEALAFFSEAAPLGAVGSYVMDRLPRTEDLFRFKHHYLLPALDSEILYRLLAAIRDRRAVNITVRERMTRLCPLKIYAGTQTGRQYVLGYAYDRKSLTFHRLDTIDRVEEGGEEPEYEAYLDRWRAFSRHLWGVSAGRGRRVEHLEMTLCYGPGEAHIPRRLRREKRCGTVEDLGPGRVRFSADVYDPREMLPWLRSFLGRIQSLTCTDASVTETFEQDRAEMEALYGIQ